MLPCVLEADLQDLASIAYEPSGLRIRKSDRPIAAYLGQAKPRASFIGSPGGRSGIEFGGRLGGDYNGLLMSLLTFFVILIAMTNAASVGKAENGSPARAAFS